MSIRKAVKFLPVNPSRRPEILNFFFSPTFNRKYNLITYENQQRWERLRRRGFLVKPKTSSPEPKLCANSKSAFQISENSAYGRVYILENHATRRRLRNPPAHQRH